MTNGVIHLKTFSMHTKVMKVCAANLWVALLATPFPVLAQGYNPDQQIRRQQAEDRRIQEQGWRIQQDAVRDAAERQRMNNMDSMPQRPPPPPASYVAVAWHPDARDVWAIWNHPSGSVASVDARGACEMVMGSPCQIAQEGSNGSVVIARSADGNLHSTGAATPDAARKQMLQACAKGGHKCEIAHVFTAVMPPQGEPVPEKYFPDGSAIRPEKRRFAAGAWSNYGARPKLWVASGRTIKRGAERAAILECQAQGRGTCAVAFSTDASQIMVYRDANGTGRVVSGADKSELERKADAACKDRGIACSAGLFLDPRDPVKREIEFAALPPKSN